MKWEDGVPSRRRLGDFADGNMCGYTRTWTIYNGLPVQEFDEGLLRHDINVALYLLNETAARSLAPQEPK